MSNFDKTLGKINGAITLPQLERSTYANDFTSIRDDVINKLKAADIVFEQLYSGTCIGGSYADNLKISQPDEFDLLICLKLRENSKVIITRSPKMPGYVRINMSESLEKMKFEKQNQLFWERFEKFTDRDGYLIQDKIQSWFEGLMTIILKGCNNSLKVNNKVYQIKYTKAGPAHTLNINGNSFSIDFVPAFVFTKKQWCAERSCPSNIDGDDTDWFAVPKPLKGQNKLNNNGPNLNFITSFNKIERRLIAKKDNLKNTLKMLKKIRDRLNIQNLKSYFIKTVYLWENEKQAPTFWQQSTTFVLMHMFEKLCNSVKDGKILFFWDRGQNMLQPLGPNQLNSMHGQLRKVYDDLNTNPEKIYDIFLTEEEKAKLSINNDVGDRLLASVQNITISPKQKSTPNDLEKEKMKTLSRAISSNNNCIKINDNSCNKNNVLGGTVKPVVTTKTPADTNDENAKKILNDIEKLMNDKKLSNVDKVKAISNECKKLELSNQKTGFFGYFF